VPAVRLGKLIIAIDDTELDALAAVAERARENGVPGMSMIRDEAQLREIEPSARCVAALYSATTGVVDQFGLMKSYAAAIQERGGWLALKHDVTAIARDAGGFAVTMIGPDGAEATITSETVVNSAGLGAPAIASMLGYDLDGTD